MPFFKLGTIPLGPLKLQWFGILVATGVLFGAWLMRVWAEKRGLDDDHVRGLVGWTVVCGFIGAHLFDVLAYQPHKIADDPLLLIKVWQGISSYGGFIGGAAGFFFYTWRTKLPIGPYADAAIIAFVPGFTFGRMGCTVVHDHIGAASDGFFLATRYPEAFLRSHGFGTPGVPMETTLHHNLGFYELLYMLVLCALLFGLTRWKNRRHGILAAAMGAAYAPIRFFLEFLRVNPEADPRYFGLTFAQWMSLVVFAASAYLVVWLLRHGRRAGEPAAEADASPATAASSGKPARPAGSGKPRRRRKKK